MKSENRLKALELAVQRWSWTRAEDERQKRESAEADAERIAFQAIDWFDFVVVETIDFPADELFDMPDVLVTGQGVSAKSTSASTINIPTAPHVRPPPPAFHAIAPPPPSVTFGNSQNSRRRDMDMDMDMDVDMDMDTTSVAKPAIPSFVDDDDDMSMNIVSDYAPRISGQQTKAMTMVDPLSGRILPVDEMGQHMKVQLLDPRWKIEQQRFQDKQRETGYAEGATIADNLRQFAQKRTDIFSSGVASTTSSVDLTAVESTNTVVEVIFLDVTFNDVLIFFVEYSIPFNGMGIRALFQLSRL